MSHFSFSSFLSFPSYLSLLPSSLPFHAITVEKILLKLEHHINLDRLSVGGHVEGSRTCPHGIERQCPRALKIDCVKYYHPCVCPKLVWGYDVRNEASCWCVDEVVDGVSSLYCLVEKVKVREVETLTWVSDWDWEKKKVFFLPFSHGAGRFNGGLRPLVVRVRYFKWRLVSYWEVHAATRNSSSI